MYNRYINNQQNILNNLIECTTSKLFTSNNDIIISNNLQKQNINDLKKQLRSRSRSNTKKKLITFDEYIDNKMN
jgi:hypothetical protein